MEQVKSALTALEQAILKLESAVYDSNKERVQKNEQIADMKRLIRATHDRLDTLISTYRKGDA